jgi:hypothetical protein
LSQIDRPITLTSLSTRNSTTVALSSSHVLLASVTSSQPPEIIFLLWDVQYSVLLSERRHPLPSYLSSLPCDKLRLKLALASKSLALLVIHLYFTAAEKEKQTAVGVKSSVLSIPYGVPESSSLKNALGKAPSTQKWIKPSKGDKPAGIHAAAEDILKKLEDILKGCHVEEAEKVFFEWLEMQTRHPENGSQINGTGDYEQESDVEMSKGGNPEKGKRRAKKVILVLTSLQ